MNIEQLNTLIENEIKKDNVLNQQVEAIYSFGGEFDELFVDINQKNYDGKLAYDVAIDYKNFKFTQDFLKRKKILEIDYEYSDYKLQINSIESEEYSLDTRKLSESIEELKEQIKNLNLDDLDDELDDDNDPRILLKKKEDDIEIIKEENKIQLERLKRDIESTFNALFDDLDKDTEKLLNRIHQLVDDYNQSKGNGLEFKDLWKSFKNDRVKASVIKTFVNNFKFKVSSKKIDVMKDNEKIRSLKSTMTAYNLWDWASILNQIKVVKEHRDIVKEEYTMMNDSMDRFEEEVEELVEDGFEELLFDLFQSADNKEDIKISKVELYKYTLSDYNKLLKNYTI